jgi:hypothetical protein
MPESDKGNNGAERKPNWEERWTLWVNAGTLGILTLTLIAVIIYARELHHANVLARQALDMDTRPYVDITPNCDLSHLTIESGKPLTLRVYLYNYGRLPTRTSTQGGVHYSRTRLPNGSEDGLLNSPDQYIWPGTYVNGAQIGGVYVLPESRDNLTDGDITDIKERKGWIYLEVETSYGNGYVTRICDEYPVDTGGQLFSEVALCSDPRSNCTDNDCN